MVEKPQGSLDASNPTDGDVSQDNEHDDFDTKLNRAITARFKQFEKSLQKQLAETFKAAPVAQPKEVQSPEDAEKAELKKQLAHLLEKDKQRDAQLATQRLQSALSEELLKVGVAPERMKHAVGFLTSVDKSVRINEDGEVVMKIDQVEYDLPSAVKAWSKSSDAKIYLSERNIKGAGASKVQSAAPVSSGTSNEEIGNALIEMMVTGRYE